MEAEQGRGPHLQQKKTTVLLDGSAVNKYPTVFLDGYPTVSLDGCPTEKRARPLEPKGLQAQEEQHFARENKVDSPHALWRTRLDEFGGLAAGGQDGARAMGV